MPKELPAGSDIPEEEEWFVPFNNNNYPDRVQEEHVFQFNALPITDALPYVDPSELEETDPTTTSTVPQGWRPGYKIPRRRSFQSNKINELLREYNSSRVIPTSGLARLSDQREKERRERSSRDNRRSPKSTAQSHQELKPPEPKEPSQKVNKDKVPPKSRPRQSTPSHQSRATPKNSSDAPDSNNDATTSKASTKGSSKSTSRARQPSRRK